MVAQMHWKAEMLTQELVSEESRLVSDARRRDERAIRALIQRHNRRLYRIARSILRDEVEAEDALQDAYLKAFLHLDDFRGDAAVGTWLGRIVMNEALGRLRRRRITVGLETMEEKGGSAEIIRLWGDAQRADPERTAAQRQIQELLEKAIDELPEEFRLVLVARAVEDMSVEETASLLDIKPETVKTRLHRARTRLRDSLEAKVGPVLKDVFPFEDPRCARVADKVVQGLDLASAREPPPPSDI
jgi:RNA polymerase sigma-70 factor (ECF subfamily)